MHLMRREITVSPPKLLVISVCVWNFISMYLAFCSKIHNSPHANPQDLRSKLQAAEQLCEELMDETEDYKKEIRALEEEIEEMQDNFREEQADEYRDLKRELEQTAKNCRVLQFKLKKAERRSDAVSALPFMYYWGEGGHVERAD